MNTRIEKSEALPTAHNTGNSRWQSILAQLRLVEIGKHLVITPDEPFTSSVGIDIERFARRRGMKVKARKRGKEIWIERVL